MDRKSVLELFPDATDEQVQGIMDLYRDGINPVKKQLNEAKDQVKALSGDAEELRAKLKESEDAAALEKLSAEERLAAQIKAAEEQQQSFAIKSNKLDAKAKFVDAGIPEEQYGDLLSKIVSADADATSALTDSLISLITAQRDAATAAAADALVHSTPNPTAGTVPTSGITKEQFDGMTYQERLQIYNESPEVYSELTGQE